MGPKDGKEKGIQGGRADMPRKGGEEPGSNGIKGAKKEDSFKKELGPNYVECSLDTMKHVN